MTVLILLAALPLVNLGSVGSNGPNQLTTVTYFTTATTLFTSSSYSFSTWAPSAIYSGSFQIPPLNPVPLAGYCSISVYTLGPFPASKGDKVSATGSTDYNLTVNFVLKGIYDTASGYLNVPAGLQGYVGCLTFTTEMVAASSYRRLTGPSSFDFDWVVNSTDDYYLVLTTDGLNLANVVLQLGLSPVYTSTISFTPTTTVTSIQGYWVGQAMIYSIVRNAFLIAGLSAVVILGAFIFVLRRRQTPKQ